jgi:hypothetical protein
MGTALSMQIDHHASCPEISPTACAAQDIPDHMHSQGIQWFRSSLGLSMGLGKGWQLHSDIPVDLKRLGIDYTLDGEPYNPPYAGIHHREETLFGLTDPTLSVQRYQGLPKDLVLGLSLGSTLPLGKTEEDPFALAMVGEEHQHFQRGTGTFVPSGRADLFWMGLRWRALGWVNGSLPLYESDLGYLPASSISYGLTAGYRLSPTIQLMALSQAQHIGPESWDGDSSNTPGRDLVMGGLGAIYAIRPGLVIQAQIRTTLWQQTRSERADDQLVQRGLGTLGLSWSPGSGTPDPG